MEEVARKYPYADLNRVHELWELYQYTDQKSYRSFLDYYEKQLTRIKPYTNTHSTYGERNTDLRIDTNYEAVG